MHQTSNCNAKHSLLKMLDNFKEALDKSNSVSALFMDLPKAFDIQNHDILIARLKAYDFSFRSHSYIYSYLDKQLQKRNADNNFNIWNIHI